MGLILIRGVSGSGKSTYAVENFPNHTLIEADDYFMIDNDYYFDRTKLAEAHDWCKWRTKTAYEHDKNIVVANTFTRLWEIEYYIDTFPIDCIIRLNTMYGNVHGVPDSVVASQLSRFDDITGETIVL